MIKKAIYSLWTKPQQAGTSSTYKPSSGFPDMECFLNSWELSVKQARVHFEKVELYTDSLGKKMLCDTAKIFKEEEVILLFDDFKHDQIAMKDLNKELWSYGKLATYSVQTEPFIHLDFDAFLFKSFDAFKHEDFIVQSVEDGNGTFYVHSRNFFKENNFDLPQEYHHHEANFADKVAYNAGCWGGCDYFMLSELAKRQLDIIEKNYDKIVSEEDKNISNFNVYIEQYLATVLTQSIGKFPKLLVNFKYDITDIKNSRSFGWIHLLGHSKFDRNKNSEVRSLLDKTHKDFRGEPVVCDWNALIEKVKNA